jgi:hypothetical protein
MIEEDMSISRSDKGASGLAPLLSASLGDLKPSSKVATELENTAPAPRSALGARSAGLGANKAPLADAPSKQARKKKELDEGEADRDETSAPPGKDAIGNQRGAIDDANATVVADVALGVARRELQYGDPVAGPLRTYTAPGIAVYGVGARIYPAASSGIAFVKDIGIVGRFTNSLAVESKTNDGSQAGRGAFQHYAVGLQARILTGAKHDSPLLGLEGTYGVWSFTFSGLDPIVNEVLAVEYKFLRVGADARIPFGAFSLLGRAGYMNISSAGPFSERFPHATIAGVDAAIGGAYAIASFVDIRALAAYTRIFSSAHPEAGDRYVAGGELDQYLVFNLGASAVF